MKESDLTQQEARYLEDLRRIPTTYRSRLLGWALELGVSTVPFAYGYWTDRTPFMLVGFLSLLYFAVWRMCGQFRAARMLRSIHAKRLVGDSERLGGGSLEARAESGEFPQGR
jgi:hypothetical protein